MGDLNCEMHTQEMQRLFSHSPLRPPPERLLSFPSWRPQRAIDHILVSEAITVSRRWVVDTAASDHLPVAAEIELPFVLDA